MNLKTEQTIFVWTQNDSIHVRCTRTQDVDADVCIVRVEIIGTTSACFLLKEGQRVIVDDGPIGGGQSDRTTAHITNARLFAHSSDVLSSGTTTKAHEIASTMVLGSTWRDVSCSAQQKRISFNQVACLMRPLHLKLFQSVWLLMVSLIFGVQKIGWLGNAKSVMVQLQMIHLLNSVEL